MPDWGSAHFRKKIKFVSKKSRAESTENRLKGTNAVLESSDRKKIGSGRADDGLLDDSDEQSSRQPTGTQIAVHPQRLSPMSARS